MKESGHLNASVPQVYAGLAACYVHLGDLAAARNAVDEMATRTPLSLREMGEIMWRAPAQRALFMEAVAKIEGE
jgi:hypothetical protein